MKRIPLTRGLFAAVDDGDFEELSKYKWWALAGRRTHYAARKNEKREVILMHREILGLGGGRAILVDHKNGNGTDNQRQNIRQCTGRQNICNRTKFSKNSSGYKGVCRKGGIYIAQIGHDGGKYHLGCFPTPEEAARAYDEAAKKMHGEFARLNFPEAGASPQTD